MRADDTATYCPETAISAPIANPLTTISRALTNLGSSAVDRILQGVETLTKRRPRDGGLHILADYVRQARSATQVYNVLVQAAAQVAGAEKVELLRYEAPGRSLHTLAVWPIVAVDHAASEESSPPAASRRWIALPLGLGNQPWGILRIVLRGHRGFPARVVRWLTTLATLAVIAEEGLRARQCAAAAEAGCRDSVSGLYEQPVFSGLFDYALLQAHRRQEPLALLHVQLDSAGGTLDPFAPVPSSIVVQRAAQAIVGTIRASDVVGRLNPERFAVILPAADAEDAPAIADAIRQAITEASETSSSDEILTASVGIACYPRDGKTADTLHKAAASALACAQAAGGDVALSAHCTGHELAMKIAPCAG